MIFKVIKEFSILLLVSLVVLIIDCNSNKIPVKYYITTKEDFIEKDSSYVKNIEKYASEYLPDSLKKKGIKYLIIYGESFKGYYVVVNKKDTINRFYKMKEEFYLGSMYYEIPFNTKKVRIEEVGRRGDLKLKIPIEYDYIEVSGDRKEWGVVYLDYPDIRTCY